MPQQTNYIVFLCYGTEGTLQECAHSLLSLSRLHSVADFANTEIWIYTDNSAFFQSFNGCRLPLHYRTIDDNTRKQWRGKIDFAHRIKIEALRELTKDKTGNILYVDSDSVFTHRIDKMLEKIQEGKLYMHVMEGIVSNRSNLIFKKLDGFLRKNTFKNIQGKPIHDLAMWNAGVLGFHTKYSHLLDDILTFTDTEYPKFPKHIVEQFACSVYFQETGEVKAAAPYITHYWNLKEVRQELVSFFEHFKDRSWDELTQLSKLIQVSVMMQEKVNFFNNRGLVKAFQKKQWLPQKRDWIELSKQL